MNLQVTVINNKYEYLLNLVLIHLLNEEAKELLDLLTDIQFEDFCLKHKDITDQLLSIQAKRYLSRIDTLVYLKTELTLYLSYTGLYDELAGIASYDNIARPTGNIPLTTEMHPWKYNIYDFTQRDNNQADYTAASTAINSKSL